MTNSPDKPAADQPTVSTVQATGARRVLTAFLNSPFAGMSPWILMALLTGPGRFEEAAASAFVLSLLLVVGGHRRGSKIKLLEVFDVAYFGTMAALALFASESVIDWLEKWGGEMTNIALVAFALGSILIRQPFTLQYARESTDEEVWDSPLFLRINYVITWAWVVGFGVAAVSGAVGDLVLDDPNDFWTGWIIQIGGTVFAIAFTEFYPDFATYRAAVREGWDTDEKPQSMLHLFDWVPIFVLAIGIAGLLTDEFSTVTGIVVIVVGAVGIGIFRQLTSSLDARLAQTAPGASETA
ncbi:MULTISPECIES: hypothetical protein [Gordonia]|uniref:Membrane protein n=1 Tax=Gordonia alkanivorans CGMCC 6845 TaxID=1423140 RepID=W9DGJ3_9ACTN|nr:MULTISPECIES: hypothetical protein [Gordonia]ETA05541.1 membrane protein [Gordonia alkanivorans CGMCC 6845]MDH3013179.1 hypothetical protein [Gordonia alkanivorans]MDH3020644.1 hypothetical protein [Gordonia alkanivorans]MDH3026176.1 hypothetical protein [Gordonia alkanivorans]MDH3048118.1 hypothetical protein [Gordonia alkanivorans]